jgi:hypothetical protein
MNARRTFLKNIISSAAALAVVSIGKSGARAQMTPGASSSPVSPAPTTTPRPPITPERVKEFVSAAHKDLPRVQELLTADPTLINATWDWGGGDFETGLGGASHMGRPDIAQFLLAHGARLDLFAAAMLGLTPVVKDALEVFPAFLNTPGPHGIPLIRHAKAGGDAAKEVLAYLEQLAAKNNPAPAK